MAKKDMKMSWNCDSNGENHTYIVQKKNSYSNMASSLVCETTHFEIQCLRRPQ